MKSREKIHIAIIACLLAIMFVGCTSEPSVIGTWSVQNLDEGQSATFEFKKNGTCIMTGHENGQLVNKIEASWTQSDNLLYFSAQGQRDIGVFEIKSLDGNSLVLSDRTYDDDETIYFKRIK